MITREEYEEFQKLQSLYEQKRFEIETKLDKIIKNHNYIDKQPGQRYSSGCRTYDLLLDGDRIGYECYFGDNYHYTFIKLDNLLDPSWHKQLEEDVKKKDEEFEEYNKKQKEKEIERLQNELKRLI